MRAGLGRRPRCLAASTPAAPRRRARLTARATGWRWRPATSTCSSRACSRPWRPRRPPSASPAAPPIPDVPLPSARRPCATAFRCSRYARRRPQAVPQGGLAPDALPVRVLPVRAGGPHEHRLRQARHAGRPGLLGSRLRPGRGRVLHRLRAVRSAQQHAAAALRRAPLAGAHHGVLGIGVGGHDVRANANAVLHHALPAGHGRGGVLSRRHLLPHWLVHARAPRQDDGGIHDRHRGRRRRGRAGFRRGAASFPRTGRLCRLAMVVPDRRRALGAAGPGHAVLSAGLAGTGPLADAARSRQVERAAAGRTRRGRRHAGAPGTTRRAPLDPVGHLCLLRHVLLRLRVLAAHHHQVLRRRGSAVHRPDLGHSPGRGHCRDVGRRRLCRPPPEHAAGANGAVRGRGGGLGCQPLGGRQRERVDGRAEHRDVRTDGLAARVLEPAHRRLPGRFRRGRHRGHHVRRQRARTGVALHRRLDQDADVAPGRSHVHVRRRLAAGRRAARLPERTARPRR